jgi:hypothetical protein
VVAGQHVAQLVEDDVALVGFARVLLVDDVVGPAGGDPGAEGARHRDPVRDQPDRAATLLPHGAAQLEDVERGADAQFVEQPPATAPQLAFSHQSPSCRREEARFFSAAPMVAINARWARPLPPFSRSA